MGCNKRKMALELMRFLKLNGESRLKISRVKSK